MLCSFPRLFWAFLALQSKKKQTNKKMERKVKQKGKRKKDQKKKGFCYPIHPSPKGFASCFGIETALHALVTHQGTFLRRWGWGRKIGEGQQKLHMSFGSVVSKRGV